MASLKKENAEFVGLKALRALKKIIVRLSGLKVERVDGEREMLFSSVLQERKPERLESSREQGSRFSLIR